MADDKLDDLENGFDDEMEDILEGSSMGDPDSDMDDFDQDDLGSELDHDPEKGEYPDESSASDEKVSLKQRLSGLSQRIPAGLKTKKVLIILGASFLALVLLAVGLLLFFGGSNEQDAQVIEQNQTAGLQQSQAQEIIFEDIVELEPFERIRLKTSSTMGLISLNISLELTDGRFRMQIYTMEDRLRHIVESQVAEMTWLELRNPDGKIRLKYELLKRMNSLFPKATVRNIYFTYFIMQ